MKRNLDEFERKEQEKISRRVYQIELFLDLVYVVRLYYKIIDIIQLEMTPLYFTRKTIFLSSNKKISSSLLVIYCVKRWQIAITHNRRSRLNFKC